MNPHLIVGYVLVCLLLDWVSFVYPMRGMNITPWNPKAALAVALLLRMPRSWWLVGLTLLLAETLVRGLPASWPAQLLASGMLTVGYAAIALALQRWLGSTPELATRKASLAFGLIVGIGALCTAVLYVASLAAFGVPPPDRLVAAVMRGWIGDTVSLVVTLPVLFVLAKRERRGETMTMLRAMEWWLIVAAAVVASVAVFGQSTEDQFKAFYLLFVPVVWGAARFGAIGAVWSAALVQVLLIVAVQLAHYQPLTVFELHMLMAALGATGLMLGTTVDEREASERALRASLRLAAAGDMAAALAHELNQPLTALSTYARAAQLLAGRQAGQPSPGEPSMAEVATKLVNEASRASDVVKRLRDFFRDRSTVLQLTDIRSLIEEVVESQSQRASALQVHLSWRCAEALPPVWMDHVQIEVVLRNLVDNALDAASEGASADATVSVQARRRGDQLEVSVLDSGSGVAPAQLPRLFESHPSSKPGGMGVGLGISRAIVEAHGGKLWTEPGPGGRFCFSLPLVNGAEP